MIAPGSTTTAPATTVTAPTASYPLDIYWVAGDAIHRERRRTVEANLDEAIRALRSGPTGEETSKGLRSAIAEAGMIVDAATASGTARIELGSSFLTLPGAEQTLAIAQIVYTVTVVPGIGQIEFTLNGQPLPVPRGDGQPSTGSVSRDDYASLLEGLRPSQSPGTQIATTTAFSEPGSGSRP